MSDSFAEFNSRVKKIERDHAGKDQGYVVKVHRDGLITFKPDQRRKSGLPMRGILFLIVGFFVFKGLILAHTGLNIYEDRVVRLSEGTMIEQAGAYVMQVDPVSQSIAVKIRGFLN